MIVKMKHKISITSKIFFSIIKKTPFRINLVITNKCNSKCRTCNTWKKKTNDSDELSYEEYAKIFKNMPKEVCWLSITGGEPFLKKDIINLVDLAINNLSGLKMVNISTNGLNRKNLMKFLQYTKKIPSINFLLNFSLDGPEKIHNHIRNVDNAYRKCLDLFYEAKKKSVKQKNIDIKIQTTVSKFNVDALEEFINFFRNDISVVTIFHKGAIYKNFVQKNDIKFNKKASYLFKKNMNILPLNTSHYLKYLYTKNLITYLDPHKKKKIDCVALKNSFTMYYNGDIFPCVIWNKKVGNLRDFNYNITNLLNTTFSKKIKQDIQDHRCPGCWIPCEAYQGLIVSHFNLKKIFRLLK
ncbi:MAG: radical SAM/SPASM domain-containing protein [Candidatus Muiribacteriota bacterium]